MQYSFLNQTRRNPMRFLLRFLTFTAALMILASNSLAADFSVKLPVELHKMRPEAKKAEVICLAVTSAGMEIGKGSQTANIPRNGNLNSSFNISFDAFNGKDPGIANILACALYIQNSSGNKCAAGTNTAIRCKPKAGTRVNNQWTVKLK
jgi:hypothetical protein